MSQDRVQSLERPLDEVSLEGRFEDLVARCRAEQDQLTAIGRQAYEILNELHAHARARANEIVASARSEAARLLADARREVADVEAQIARLRESQRETAERFDSTRRALEAEVADLEAQITRLRESEREAAERLDSTRRALEAELLERPAPRPAYLEEAVAHRVETPTPSTEAPAHAIEAPTRSIGLRAHAVEAPTRSIDVRAHAVEAPTRPIEVPAQAIGAPTGAVEARVQAIGAPEHDIEVRLQGIKAAVQAIEAPAGHIEAPASPLEGRASPIEEPISARPATAVATAPWRPSRTYIEIPPAGQEADDETSSLTAFKMELHRSSASGTSGRVFVKPAIVVLAAAALVAAVGITIAWMSGGSESEHPPASPPAAGAPSSAPVDRPEDRPAATPAAMTSATAPAPEPAALTSVGSAGEAPAGAPPRGELEVRLEARRPSWIRATIDGVSENGYVLKAGETRMLSANAGISVRAGDAGALLVSVNGGKPAPLGRDGQVLTRHFGRSPAAAAPAPKAEENPDRTTTPERPSSQPSSTAAARVSAPQPAAPPLPTVAPPPSAPAASLKAEGLTPPGPPTTVRQQILQADRQWFDAYYRGDKAMLSRLNAPGFEIVDERPPALRFSAGAQVRARALSDVRVDTHGDGAVLSARMIERVVQDGRAGQYESYVSEIWIRRDGQWRLMGLRLASAGQVEERAADPAADPVP